MEACTNRILRLYGLVFLKVIFFFLGGESQEILEDG